jgi:ABC-type bacteriocin/lantibiotic exporter with double-glycine peptidase domain
VVNLHLLIIIGSYNNYFPGSVFKLTISFAFLLVLVGWQSLLAGIVVMAIIIPFNIYNSKRYAEIQRSLMKVRDEKLGVVTEALQGLRQIKFMGIEKQWQGKIMEVRDRELDELWKSYIADTILLFCWFASPILFSAASLTMYAILYGELTPSVRGLHAFAVLISAVSYLLVVLFGLVIDVYSHCCCSSGLLNR